MGDGPDENKHQDVHQKLAEAMQQELPEALRRIWHTVLTHVIDLLDAHGKYGFIRFSEKVDPSLTEMIQGLEWSDAGLKLIIEGGKLEYDEYRDAINSIECIRKMRAIAQTLQDDDQEEYDRLIGELEKQSKF